VTDVTGNGDYLRYSTKELLADINHKMDALGIDINRKLDAFTTQTTRAAEEQDRRLGVLEGRLALADELSRRLVGAERTLVDLSERVSVHLAQDWHQGTQERIRRVDERVATLAEKAVAQEALRDLWRWQLPTTIAALGALLGVLGLALGIVHH